VLGEDGEEPAVQIEEAIGKGRLGVGPDLAVGDVAETIPVGPDHPPPRAAEAGIEAEDDQSLSMTSSGTS
jgi:hypothetical protein